MIPATNDGVLTFGQPDMTSNTFQLNLDTERVGGFVDQMEAMKQAIYLILSIERYEYPIYSRSHGVELASLIGQPIHFVLPEIKRRVTEALAQDDRITGTDNWTFDTRRGSVAAGFTVKTIWGDLETNMEVSV